MLNILNYRVSRSTYKKKHRQHRLSQSTDPNPPVNLSRMGPTFVTFHEYPQMEVSTVMGVPLYRWMVYKGKSQSEMDDLGVPHLWKPLDGPCT